MHFWVGTFNLNGRADGVNQDLSAWLCPELKRLHQQPEIVAVGFQEIVELSPQQIMSTDPARRRDWELAVKKTLNENARKSRSEDYILLRSGQLVGAALLIFVKPSILGDIKNVEGSVRKVSRPPSHENHKMGRLSGLDWHVRNGWKQRRCSHSYGLCHHQDLFCHGPSRGWLC